MAETIDARGLSCPQPIIKTTNAIKAAGEGEVTVIVDTMTQVNNCIRAAEQLGWKAEVEERGDDYYLTLKK
jgi:tRNA 2-thiouridine synthesizing protein A